MKNKKHPSSRSFSLPCRLRRHFSGCGPGGHFPRRRPQTQRCRMSQVMARHRLLVHAAIPPGICGTTPLRRHGKQEYRQTGRQDRLFLECRTQWKSDQPRAGSHGRDHREMGKPAYLDSASRNSCLVCRSALGRSQSSGWQKGQGQKPFAGGATYIIPWSTITHGVDVYRRK